MRAALLAAERLGAQPGLKFSGHELQLVVNDRLLAPNTDETWQAARPELAAFFDQLYGPGRYTPGAAPRAARALHGGCARRGPV